MSTSQTVLLTYSELRHRQQNSVLRQSEIPVEHAISLPLPTRRWGIAGYAYFASPALRIPGKPTEQGAPDRWWLVDANNGHLLIFAQWHIMPFAESTSWTKVQLPLVAVSMSELRQTLAEIDNLMDQLSPAFFAGEAGYAEARAALLTLLLKYLPKPLISQYRALAPDFLEWLETDNK